MDLPQPQRTEQTQDREFFMDRKGLIARHKEFKTYVDVMSKEFTVLNLQESMVAESTNEVRLNPADCVRLKDVINAADRVNGKFLLCRSICPPMKIEKMCTVFDDPIGELAVQIFFYNCEPNAVDSLPVGTILAIQNPLFTKTDDGGYGITCDYKSDVITLNETKVRELFGSIQWKGEIPAEYRTTEATSGESSSVLESRQDDDYQSTSKRYKADAEPSTSCTDAEATSRMNEIDLLSKRSADYLSAGSYDSALNVAESVLNSDQTNMQCIGIKANALFGMAKYEDAVNFLSNLSLQMSEENEQTINDLILKGRKYFEQSNAGEYPWEEIYRNTLEEFNHDLAEYEGPVGVKDTLNRGKGLFATKKIVAGQLVLGSKPFAHAVLKKDTLFNADEEQKLLMCKGQLIMNMVDVIKRNRHRNDELYGLFAGKEYIGKPPPPASNMDLQRLTRICSFNSFGNTGFGKSIDIVSGVWITASYINHSCVDSNCFFFRNGNFLFVRAFRDIEKDEEILIPYGVLGINSQANINHYEFTCDCRLCVRDRSDSQTVAVHRVLWQRKLEDLLGPLTFENDGGKFLYTSRMAMDILKLLKDSRIDAPELNVGLVKEMVSLANYCFVNEHYETSVKILEETYDIMKNFAATIFASMTVVSRIIRSYLMMFDKRNAERWIEVLKERSILYLGTYGSVESLVPKTVELMRMWGLYRP